MVQVGLVVFIAHHFPGDELHEPVVLALEVVAVQAFVHRVCIQIY